MNTVYMNVLNDEEDYITFFILFHFILRFFVGNFFKNIEENLYITKNISLLKIFVLQMRINFSSIIFHILYYL